ncbi:MAG: outer membrane protein transport protein [Beijerinckiaceae bacterium]|nr:outer membrane protein transport protein [Beijerinckiaceae bacterium]
MAAVTKSGLVGNSRAVLLAAASLSALVAGSSAANAGAFALREQNAAAQGSAFAGVAAGDGGVSSQFWNPAIITQYPGIQFQQNLSIIIPQSDIRFTSGPTLPFGQPGDIGQAAALPAGGSSYQLTDKIFLGLSTGAPYGLITKPENPNNASQLYGRSSKVFSFNATPSIAYKFNDWISIGAGIQVQYFRVTLKQALGTGANSPNAILRGDDINFGFTAGLTLTPFQGTNFGVGYRYGINHDLEGYFAAPGFRTRITAPTDLPDVVTVGLTQDINDKVKVKAGFEWTRWSKFSSFPVTNSATGGPLVTATGPVNLAFRYDDGYYFSLGADYKFNPNWTVRGGLAYEISPISDAARGVRLPDNDRFWVNVGASYAWNDQLTFDVSYAHAFVGRTPINLTPGNPAYNPLVPVQLVGTADASVDIFSVGVRYVYGVAPKREAPIVRKY